MFDRLLDWLHLIALGLLSWLVPAGTLWEKISKRRKNRVE